MQDPLVKDRARGSGGEAENGALLNYLPLAVA